MTAPQHEGRLELTWTNKHRRLLSHEDGLYEWTDPGDHRVAEVRLLHDVTTVGDTHGKRDRAKDNLLIRGDALHALRSLAKLPEFRDEYVGQVKLCYIDPPFNTGQAFAQYDDALEHSVWLTMMRDRLVQVRELLSPQGSVWVHLDDTEVHRARCILDEVFGGDCHVATVVWQKADSPRMDAKQFSTSHDSILVYSRMPEWNPNRFTQQVDDNLDDDGGAEGYPYADEDGGRRFKSSPLRKWGKNSNRKDRPNLWYPIEAPDGQVVWPVKPDGTEGNWRWQKEKVAVDAHRLQWIDKGSGLQPYVKTYEDEDQKPRPPETWWPNIEVGHNRSAKAHIKQMFGKNNVFETPKPEQLLHRILYIASSANDIVLDCFSGSGTTAAVAAKTNRRWVASEWSRDTVERFTLPRLTRVVGGHDPGGVTAQLGWEGGGGLRVLDVAPSMFAVHESRVVLADWAVNGALGEAVAAQVGFTYSPDPPFIGVKGRTRLAVVDGLVDKAVVTMLAGWLPDGELMTVYGTAVDPASKEALRAIRRGCTVRKIPQSVLDEYRRRGRSDGLNWPSEVVSDGEQAAAVPVGTVTA
jgi:adenine-specific DNA-methyltransferase